MLIPKRGTITIDTTIDLLYTNVEEAYTSIALPPLGRSDHSIIHLKPLYIPAAQRQPVTTKTVQRLTPDTVETLQGRFEVTDWNVFLNTQEKDINGLADSITAYINFCTDSTKVVDCALLP